MTTMGTIGTIIMVPPILLSFPIVRNNFYNLFYFSHLLLHVGIVFLWLHAGSDLYYMLPAIGLYATDLLLRLIARFSPQRVLRVTPTSGGLVRIDFDIRSGTTPSVCPSLSILLSFIFFITSFLFYADCTPYHLPYLPTTNEHLCLPLSCIPST